LSDYIPNRIDHDASAEARLPMDRMRHADMIRELVPGVATVGDDVVVAIYARTIPDRDRDEWVRLEIESNPLPICTRPQVLRSARRT
jgi:hypothetical protein